MDQARTPKSRRRAVTQKADDDQRDLRRGKADGPENTASGYLADSPRNGSARARELSKRPPCHRQTLRLDPPRASDGQGSVPHPRITTTERRRLAEICPRQPGQSASAHSSTAIRPAARHRSNGDRDPEGAEGTPSARPEPHDSRLERTRTTRATQIIPHKQSRLSEAVSPIQVGSSSCATDSYLTVHFCEMFSGVSAMATELPIPQPLVH
jgi:hypothetical protein